MLLYFKKVWKVPEICGLNSRLFRVVASIFCHWLFSLICFPHNNNNNFLFLNPNYANKILRIEVYYRGSTSTYMFRALLWGPVEIAWLVIGYISSMWNILYMTRVQRENGCPHSRNYINILIMRLRFLGGWLVIWVREICWSGPVGGLLHEDNHFPASCPWMLTIVQ